MTKERIRQAPAPDAGLFTLEQLAARWQLHPENTRIRARAAKIPFVRISAKAIRYRVSDVLKFEEQCAVTEPSAEQVEHTAMMRSKRKGKGAGNE